MANKSAAAKRVLVVEDDFDFATLLRSILVQAGYTVEIAHTCEHAILYMRHLNPDLITLDIQMPRESGLLFYRRLKADRTLRDIPVIVVTGLTRSDKNWGSFLHAFLEPEHVPHPEAYVEKPVDAPRLLATVRETLSSSAFVNC